MSRKDSGRSGRGFWSFLRTRKTPLPEQEHLEDREDLIEEKGTPEVSEEDASDVLFAWDTDQSGSGVESSSVPSESSEKAKDRRAESSAWEISEEAETWESESLEGERSEEVEARKHEPLEGEISEETEVLKFEASEEEYSEQVETREPEESTSECGTAVEELRMLEEQVASLESCIAERLDLHR